MTCVARFLLHLVDLMKTYHGVRTVDGASVLKKVDSLINLVICNKTFHLGQQIVVRQAMKKLTQK